eukprot:987250-Amphidinium_carterae.1
MAGLARGCCRQPLRDLKPFAFLVDAPLDIWFQLISKSARYDDSAAVRQLAKLCTVLVEAKWQHYHNSLALATEGNSSL